VPKYLNSPATVLYDKGRTLFGLWEARAALAAGAVPVIAEGPLDVLAVAQARTRRYVPVAPCGTALTARQVSALSQAVDLAATGVLVAFYGDAAGRRAAISAYRLLSAITGRIAAVAFPGGQDPAQILRDQGPAALAEALDRYRRPLADLVIDAHVARWEQWLGYSEGQIAALRALAPVIAGLAPADVARQVARLADRLGLDDATVTVAVTDAVSTTTRRRPHRRGSRRAQGEPGPRPGAAAEVPPPAAGASSQDHPSTSPPGTGHQPTAALMPAAGASQPAGTGQARLRSGRVPG
jgi:DNA primase